MWVGRLTAVVLVVGVGVAGTAGCGNDGSSQTAGGDGRAVAEDAGCAVCHGDEGQGGVGPAWEGLAGSTVELVDGRQVEADDAYIRRSILDPGADVVTGYSVSMPEVDLDDEQVDALVDYIQSLR